jgi:hypothetical protein
MANTKALIFLITVIVIYTTILASFGMAEKETEFGTASYSILGENPNILDYISMPFRVIGLIFNVLFNSAGLFNTIVISSLFSIMLVIIIIDYVIPMVRGN